MKEVATLPPQSFREDVGGQNRDFDFVRPLSSPPLAQYKQGQEISAADILETIQRSVDGNGKSHVLLKDGYEAMVTELEGNRRRILELTYIERGND